MNHINLRPGAKATGETRTKTVAMIFNRIAVVVLAVLCTSCISHVDYVYLRLTDERAAILEQGDPPVQGYRGDPIPLAYLVSHATGDLKVIVGKQSYIPDIDIIASVPISKVETGDCARIVGKSTTDGWKTIGESTTLASMLTTHVSIQWNYWRPPALSCLNVGDNVEIKVSFVGMTETLLLTGKVERAGTFIHIDAI